MGGGRAGTRGRALRAATLVDPGKPAPALRACAPWSSTPRTRARASSDHRETAAESAGRTDRGRPRAARAGSEPGEAGRVLAAGERRGPARFDAPGSPRDGGDHPLAGHQIHRELAGERPRGDRARQRLDLGGREDDERGRRVQERKLHALRLAPPLRGDERCGPGLAAIDGGQRAGLGAVPHRKRVSTSGRYTSGMACPSMPRGTYRGNVRALRSPGRRRAGPPGEGRAERAAEDGELLGGAYRRPPYR